MHKTNLMLTNAALFRREDLRTTLRHEVLENTAGCHVVQLHDDRIRSAGPSSCYIGFKIRPSTSAARDGVMLRSERSEILHEARVSSCSLTKCLVPACPEVRAKPIMVLRLSTIRLNPCQEHKHPQSPNLPIVSAPDLPLGPILRH